MKKEQLVINRSIFHSFIGGPKKYLSRQIKKRNWSSLFPNEAAETFRAGRTPFPHLFWIYLPGSRSHSLEDTNDRQATRKKLDFILNDTIFTIRIQWRNINFFACSCFFGFVLRLVSAFGIEKIKGHYFQGDTHVLRTYAHVYNKCV